MPTSTIAVQLPQHRSDGADVTDSQSASPGSGPVAGPFDLLRSLLEPASPSFPR
jgi:hypothetical protein